MAYNLAQHQNHRDHKDQTPVDDPESGEIGLGLIALGFLVFGISLFFC